MNIKSDGVTESDEKHERGTSNLVIPQTQTSNLDIDIRTNKIFLEEEDLNNHVGKK